MGKVITLPEPLLQQASETARQKGIEVDALVIEAVERYLEEQWEDHVALPYQAREGHDSRA